MPDRPRGARGILFNPETRRVLLQKRDGQAPVNPYQWGLFGGLGEPQETPDKTLRRELREELGVDLETGQMAPLWDYLSRSGVHLFVFAVEWHLSKEEMRLGEGEDFDWFSLEEGLRLDLTEGTRRDLQRFQATFGPVDDPEDHVGV